MEDKRNVTDEFKMKPHDEIIAALDKRGVKLEIAIENLERDFNMGTIVRSANAFGVRTIHVVGRRQWNKRGAMATEKYLRVVYHSTVAEFVAAARKEGRRIVAIDNVPGSENLNTAELAPEIIMVFGAEGTGISEEMLQASDGVIAIEQFGSTRSINVGVAAGIAMYEWVRRNYLQSS